MYAGLVKKAVVILAVQPQACSTSCYAISIAICVVIAFGFVAVFFYLADFYALHGASGSWCHTRTIRCGLRADFEPNLNVA